MYYPYLRAKQFELKALKDFFQECPDEQRIIPILEPVNESTTALQSALSFFIEHGKRFALVMNPKIGAFKHSSVTFGLPVDFPELVSIDLCTPAFLVDNDVQVVIDRLDLSPNNNVMIIFPQGADSENEKILNLVNNEKVTSVVCSFSQTTRRTRNYLLGLGKSIVTFEDNFNEQKRNADYLNNEDEHFSETFRYYDEDHFQGFADYTALPSSFSSEGMLPYALAIHLTYLLHNDQINIHHFVSDSNRDQSNIRGKFFEAAQKVVGFYGEDRYRTASVNEIIEMVR